MIDAGEVVMGKSWFCHRIVTLCRRAVRFCGGVDTSGTELKRRKDLRCWHLLDPFAAISSALRRQGCLFGGSTPQNLCRRSAFCLLLFGLFNPALKSCARFAMPAAGLKKMRRVCSCPIAAASFFRRPARLRAGNSGQKWSGNWPVKAKAGRSVWRPRACGRLSSPSRRWTAPCCGRSTA